MISLIDQDVAKVIFEQLPLKSLTSLSQTCTPLRQLISALFQSEIDLTKKGIQECKAVSKMHSWINFKIEWVFKRQLYGLGTLYFTDSFLETISQPILRDCESLADKMASIGNIQTRQDIFEAWLEQPLDCLKEFSPEGISSGLYKINFHIYLVKMCKTVYLKMAENDQFDKASAFILCVSSLPRKIKQSVLGGENKQQDAELRDSEIKRPLSSEIFKEFFPVYLDVLSRQCQTILKEHIKNTNQSELMAIKSGIFSFKQLLVRRHAEMDRVLLFAEELKSSDSLFIARISNVIFDEFMGLSVPFLGLYCSGKSITERYSGFWAIFSKELEDRLIPAWEDLIRADKGN